MNSKYNKRVWLNNIDSDSTGSMVAYDGEVTDLDSKNIYEQRFLEIADCKNKVRLHQTSDDTLEDFLVKITLLRDELTLFIDHLENTKLNAVE